MPMPYRFSLPFRRFSAFLLATGLLVAQALAQGPGSGPAPSNDASLAVNTAKVELAPFTRFMNLNGEISAWQDVIIAPEVGGYRVEEVLVDIGDEVSKGQVLVKLSTALLEAELAARQAAWKQREAALVNADLALGRGRSVAGRNLLAAADLDRLESEALSARAALEAAKADLEQAELRLRFASVTAPDDGIISARTVTVGQLAQAGGEMLRLLRQGRVEWRGEVPETSLPDLAPGQPVMVSSADGREHEGRVRVVSPTVNPNTHNGTVYVDLPSDPALRPGMFARGRIEFGQTQALLVPLSSLVSSDGYTYVFVVQPDASVRRQMIQTGTLQGDSIVVLGGLQAGASIVTSGAGFLKDGDRVNVVREN